MVVAVAVDFSFESVMRAVVQSVVGGRWLDFCFSLNEEGLSLEQHLGPMYRAITKKPSCRRLCIRRPCSCITWTGLKILYSPSTR